MSEQAPTTVSPGNAESRSDSSLVPAKNTLPLRRIFNSESLIDSIREIVIVTLGILIAFALNAWWEEHKQAKQERQLLRTLVSDFDENISRLQTIAKAEDGIAERSMNLLEAAQGTEKIPAERIRDLLNGVFSSSRFEPVMGAYDALVNSAGLTLLSNDKLKSSLADFSAIVNGRYSERFSDEMYFIFIRDFGDRLQLSAVVTGNAPAPKAFEDLVADRKFQEYLALRKLNESQMAERYRDLLAKAKAIRAMLQIEIK